MKQAGKTPDQIHAAEAEFMPPISVLQAEKVGFGIPWERELRAVQAWQAAGGNVDSEWDVCVWEAHATMAPDAVRLSRALGLDAANEPPTMATVVRLTTSLVSLRERLFRMQNEVTEVARVEMRERRAPAPGIEAASERAVVRRPLGSVNSERILRLARNYVAALDLARAGMAGLVGLQSRNEAADEPSVDRRRNRVLIDFPDRRSAG